MDGSGISRRQRWSRWILLLFLSSLVFFAISLAVAAVPAPPRSLITVNSTADLVADDGRCTLREAITAANDDAPSGANSGECPAGAGADVIALPAGVYTLTLGGAGDDANAGGDLDVASSLRIGGAGAAETLILGNGVDRLLHVLPGGDLVVEQVTLQNGTAVSAGGGAIYHQGRRLHLRAGAVVANSAAGAFPQGRGGGIWASGPLTITDSLLEGNQAARDGGGLYKSGAGLVTLIDTQFRGNEAFLNGGALYNQSGGLLVLSRTQVVSNVAGFSGGGLYNQGMATVDDSVFSGNGATLNGGAIYNREAVLSLNGSTLVANQAENGGGLYNRDGAATLAATTLSGQEAQAGAALANAAQSAPAAIDLRHVTAVSNTAVLSGSVVWQEEAGETATVQFTNSLLAGPDDVSLCDGGGAFLSAGYNLGDAAGCGLAGAHDQILPLPLLPLADNGGAAPTHLLPPGSPARDAIPAGENGCGVSGVPDQRGVSRPQGAGCDVGVVEMAVTAPQAGPLFLPLVMGPPEEELQAPDLIVQDVAVMVDDVSIVILNQGETAVVNGFWVDLYIDPDPPPTGVNETWDQLAEQGMVWGVTDVATLVPGGSITLDLAHPAWEPQLSEFDGEFDAGSEIYVQVDSASQSGNTGGVLETHEISGDPYNNIVHLTVSFP